MEPIQSLINETKRYSLQIGRSYWVNFTHINNPHSFFVRPQEYGQYMTNVPIPGDPVSASDIKIGAIVIFKSKVTKDFVRGKIILVEGEGNKLKCDLFAIDVGCLEDDVPMQELWKPYHQVNLPALAFHCQLYNCIARAENWSESTVEAIRSYVQGQIVKIKIKNILPDVLLVKVSVHSPDDLSSLLAITRHSHMNSTDELDCQIIITCNAFSNFYCERTLQPKSILHVRMLSGSFLDKFFAAEIDDYNTYLVESEKYTEYAFKERSLYTDQLTLNRPIGVFYHRTNKFERGIVREIFHKQNKAKVELVDWGKMVEESTDYMRPLPGEFLCNPPIAIYFGLHISQYETTKLSEISKLAAFTGSSVEFCLQIEEVSEIYDNPNLVTVFGIKA